jgi:hypothetical protein
MATTQLTIMELVIGKLKGRAISTALVESPCSSDDWAGSACGVIVDRAIGRLTMSENVGLTAITANARRRSTLGKIGDRATLNCFGAGARSA